MRSKIWLNVFLKSLDKMSNVLDASTGDKWTQSMGLVMDTVGKELHCGVVRRRPEASDKEESGEYLNIDFMFFDEKDYDEDNNVLPRAVIEHENMYNPEKIQYCLWKILCINTPLKVLICYQANASKIIPLKKQLEDTVRKGRLMDGAHSDLLIIIGDDTKDDDSEWHEIFNVFEWRNDRLEIIKN